MKSLFDTLFLAANVVAAIALFAALRAPSIHPGEQWIYSLLGTAFPLLFVINLVCFIYWMVRGKLYFLLSLVLLLSSYSAFFKFFSFQMELPPDAGKNAVKVMSYNVQNFKHSNYGAEKKEQQKIIDLIKREAPDILTLQEFYTDDTKSPFISMISEGVGLPNYHFEPTISFKNGQQYGIATFSRFPLQEKRKISLPGSRTNLISSCVVKLPTEKKVQLFNVHLQSFKLGREDYQLIEELPDKGPDIEQSKSLLRKLKKGFEMRALQADILRKEMDRSANPVIVAGDFNDTPVSYTYQTLSSGMNDAFLKGGFGSGGTYAGPLPSFRIDYLLADTLFVVHDFEVISSSNTDHYPITTTLSLAQ